MSYWKQMKIIQAGTLLRLQHPDVLRFWRDWENRILSFTDYEVRDPSYLKSWPKPLAVYFLAFIAVICESARGNRRPTVGQIDAAYHLDLIFNRESGTHWLSAMAVIFPHRTIENCWECIPDYVESWTDIGPDTSLKKLLERIRIENRQAHSAAADDEFFEQEKLIIPQCVDNFTNVMDSFDGEWPVLCENYCFQNGTLRTLHSLIRNGVRQIILTGAPGTGKTHAAREIAEYLGELTGEESVPLVQFHPSYDYTDFVEGLRPVQLTGETKSTFVRLDGSFKAFCRSVAEENRSRSHTPAPVGNAADPRCADAPDGSLYFFLIDEINRANLSQVFGELMFCLESDKRGLPVQTQYRNLPTYRIGADQKAVLIEDDVFACGFFIPKNVVIIGTMNDIDRSVESMDFALRRRFVWHEVKADHALLLSAFESGNLGTLLRDHAGEAARRVCRLNAVIEQGARFGLNRHYHVAQGQFSLPGFRGTTLDDLMRFVWEHRIEPLLWEYLRGEDTADASDFVQTCADALGISPADRDDDSAPQEEE